MSASIPANLDSGQYLSSSSSSPPPSFPSFPSVPSHEPSSTIPNTSRQVPGSVEDPEQDTSEPEPQSETASDSEDRSGDWSEGSVNQSDMTPRKTKRGSKSTPTTPTRRSTRLTPGNTPNKPPRTSPRKAAVNKMQKRTGFPILELPDEIRLKIYNFILPRGERIFLDPQQFYRPLPYVYEGYGSTFNLLQTCKQIRMEVAEYIFHNNNGDKNGNMVNIIRPELIVPADFLAKLGKVNCDFLRSLECHIDGDMGSLGAVWQTMEEDCPSLIELRLVFYHERVFWGKTAAQLINHIVERHASDTDNSLLHPTFELDLYDSIWHSAVYGHEINEHFVSVERARRHAQVYSFKLPHQLKKIVVTASVSNDVEQAVKKLRFQAENGTGKVWQFKRILREPILYGNRNLMRMTNV